MIGNAVLFGTALLCMADPPAPASLSRVASLATYHQNPNFGLPLYLRYLRSS